MTAAWDDAPARAHWTKPRRSRKGDPEAPRGASSRADVDALHALTPAEIEAAVPLTSDTRLAK
jgi:hypothetical protein